MFSHKKILFLPFLFSIACVVIVMLFVVKQVENGYAISYSGSLAGSTSKVTTYTTEHGWPAPVLDNPNIEPRPKLYGLKEVLFDFSFFLIIGCVLLGFISLFTPNTNARMILRIIVEVLIVIFAVIVLLIGYKQATYNGGYQNTGNRFYLTLGVVDLLFLITLSYLLKGYSKAELPQSSSLK